jgi:hypothetical protein
MSHPSNFVRSDASTVQVEARYARTSYVRGVLVCGQGESVVRAKCRPPVPWVHPRLAAAPLTACLLHRLVDGLSLAAA